MYEDVLIATDGSDLASRAADQGISIAAHLGARVHAVSVADVREGSPNRDRVRDECREFVDDVETRATARDVVVDGSVRDGRPHHELLAAAEEADVDILVLGTRGRTGVRRWLLGSTAIGVIRAARRPVLSVGRLASDVPRAIERILVAADGRPGAEPAVEHALGLAAAFDAEVHALSVVDDVHSNLAVVLEAFEERAEMTTTDVVSRAAERDLSARRAIERGVPHDAIVEYAGEHGIDLVVVGTESRSSVERIAMGSVSQRVVAASPAPVVTVRPSE